MSVRSPPAAFAGLAAPTRIARALAEAARPEPIVGIAEWAARDRYVAAESGSSRAGKWLNETTPFAVEIMDCLEAEHPARTVTLKIASQIVKSEIILNWIGYTIAADPAPMMLVLPSLNDVRLWNATKWEPTRKATPAIRDKVADVIDRRRAGDSSTTNFKAFRGGSLIVASSSSSKELQARSVKRIAMDEISEWPEDTGGRGDPVDQAITRADAHADAKFLLASTPGELPGCRITRYYERGDRREYFCPCPHCGAYQGLNLDRLAWFAGEAGMACLSCGAILVERDKRAMLAAGVWLKTYPSTDGSNPAPPDWFEPGALARWRARPGEGRDPSFWLEQTYSPFKAWSALKREADAAETGGAEAQKTFRQQKRALAWDPAIDAPDHEALMGARGAHVARGLIPAWACLVTGAADVQNNRIEWAAYAWGPDKAGARFDWGVCEGDTLTDAPWIDLARVIGRRWRGAACVDLGFDSFAIDSGGGKGRTARTYQFCGRSANIRAIKGASDQRALPYEQGHVQRAKLMSGAYAQARVDLVGGHEVKHIVMAMLHRSLDAHGLGERLGVALYYTADTPEEHFKQLTAELYRQPRSRRAGARGHWEKISGRANEQLDLAVYCYAQAWDQGLERWGPSEWANLIAARARPAEDAPLLALAQREAQAGVAALGDAPHTEQKESSEAAPDNAPAGPPAAALAPNPRPGAGGGDWIEKLKAMNRAAMRGRR